MSGITPSPDRHRPGPSMAPADDSVSSAQPSGDPHPTGQVATEVVDEAVRALRSRRDPRWVEVSDRLLDSAVRATRRSYLVRAQAPSGPVLVAEQVLVTRIREVVEGAVADAALTAVKLDLVGRDTVAGVTLSVVARYGVALLPVADHLRELAAARLAEDLGPVDVPVRVELLHVHVGDVVTGDPRRSDPWSS